jgi:Ca2+-binding EF-hand superfamily protein
LGGVLYDNIKIKLKKVMKFRYFLVTAVLATAILCSATSASAQSTDINTMIAQLQAQIASLLAQIADLQAQQGTTTPWCHTFNKNLGFADSGSSEVGYLQTALAKESFGSGDSGNIYGEATAAAVVGFQEKYGILRTGYVGPLTRAKLNALYGCSTTCTPGQIRACPSDYNPGNIPAGATQTCQSWGQWGACASNSTQPSSLSLSMVSPQYAFAGNVITLLGNFPTWQLNINNNKVPYRILFNDAWIAADGLSSIGNNELSFSLPVALKTICIGSGGICPANDLQVTPGVYSVSVMNPTTGEISNKVNLIVGSSSNPSITVTSPNGGEVWKVGENRQISWTSSGVDNVYIIVKNADNGKTCNLTPNGVLAAKGFYDYFPITATAQCTEDILVGSKMRVYVRTTNSTSIPGDESDNYFTITSATQTPQQKAFSALDTNSDGTITGDEAVKGFQAFGTTWNKSTGNAGFNATFDFDNSGTISNGDFSYLSALVNTLSANAQSEVSMFRALDSNSDLVLTNSEAQANYNAFQSAFGKSTGQTGFVSKFDVDNSGTINSGDYSYLSAVVNALGLSISSTQPSITVTKNMAVGDQSVLPNTANIKIGSYLIQNTSSYQSVKLSSFNIATAATNLNNITALRTSDTTGTGAVPVIPTGSDNFQVYDTLQPGQAMTLDIFANLSSAQSGTIKTNLTVSGSINNVQFTQSSVAGQIMTIISTQPSITVTSPNGGETWEAGTLHTVTWNSTNPLLPGSNYPMWRALLYKDDVQYSILESSANASGYFGWTIPSNLSGNKFKIKIEYYIDSGLTQTVSDMSDNYFTITAATQLQCNKCTDMNGDGLITPTDNIYVINRIGKCSGNTGYDAKADIDNDGCITSNDSTCVQNQLGKTDNKCSTSQPSITVTSPNGGETWEAGSTHNITWQSTGMSSTDKVGINIVKTDGGSAAIAFNLSPTAGSYSWQAGTTLAGKMPAGNYKIQVVASSGSKYFIDTSDNYFAITEPTAGSSATNYNPLDALSSQLASIASAIAQLLGQ